MNISQILQSHYWFGLLIDSDFFQNNKHESFSDPSSIFFVTMVGND